MKVKAANRDPEYADERVTAKSRTRGTLLESELKGTYVVNNNSNAQRSAARLYISGACRHGTMEEACVCRQS
jgi:hypothetical protein